MTEYWFDDLFNLNWVVQPVCELNNQYELITAQHVFEGACAKKCCLLLSNNTNCPSQCMKLTLMIVQTDVLSCIWF